MVLCGWNREERVRGSHDASEKWLSCYLVPASVSTRYQLHEDALQWHHVFLNKISKKSLKKSFLVYIIILLGIYIYHYQCVSHMRYIM